MTRRFFLFAIVFGALLATCQTTPAAAASLKISPLRDDVTLSSGEKKKGFVDVTNPTGDKTRIKLSVQSFRQTGADGSLEFYDNEKIQSGVLLDYDEVTLGPRETLRLAFVLDAAKLASGDNFATIFATTVPEENGAGEQAVRVGTLLFISNGTPSNHSAEIQNLSGQLFQFGDGLQVSFDVHNTAKSEESTGFAPTISVTAWPYVNDTVTGPLVFAGHTRSVTYVKSGSYLGVLAIKVKSGSSEQTMYRFVMTGHWRFFAPFVLIVTGLLVWLVLSLRKGAHNRGKST